jgi:hypothetical protein
MIGLFNHVAYRAALNTFQKTCLTPGEGPLLANSSIIAYLGIDKRDGLVSVGKQLLQGVCCASLWLIAEIPLCRNQFGCIKRHLAKVLSRR